VDVAKERDRELSRAARCARKHVHQPGYKAGEQHDWIVFGRRLGVHRSDGASDRRHGSSQVAQPILIGRGDQRLPSRVKTLSFGSYGWNKTIAQREAGYEAECGAPEARARRDFGVPVLGGGIPIAGVQEVESTFSRENRGRDDPRLNLWSGWGRGVFDPALRRANRFPLDRGKPDCGGLKVSGG